jgi:hypothetical protein
MQGLTHKAATDNPDQDTMTLAGISDDSNTVTVYFDGDESNTAKMATGTYDKLTEGDDWEAVGFE